MYRQKKIIVNGKEGLINKKMPEPNVFFRSFRFLQNQRKITTIALLLNIKKKN